MFKFILNKNKKKIINEKVQIINDSIKDIYLSNSIDKNIKTLKSLFKDVDILKIRYIKNNNNDNLNFCIAYCDGIVNASIINDNIIKPLMLTEIDIKTKNKIIDNLSDNFIQINQLEKVDTFQKIVEAITYGQTVLFVENSKEALILESKKFEIRSIAEPDSEKVLSGPREGFCETILINLSLVRRRIRTNDLKMKYCSIGKKTNTQVCICYMDSIVNKNILNELYRRLDTIDTDTILDANYINELIRDNPLSPFRTAGYTERPDVVVGKILEGRIAIFVDGTPVVLTVPYLFVENFQSNEDYYLSYYYSSFSRILRIVGFLLTITVPGLYISVVGFHHEMLPTPLLLSIAASRQDVPLPASLEIFLLLLVFDILKETGIRMPSNIGQALSIVGALVIGQAAVEAKLVAASMIIVVSITAITSLLVPKLRSPVIFARGLILLLSVSFGIFGMVWALSFIFIHMLSLHSFGVSQVMLPGKLQFQDIKDTFLRAPWYDMVLRPKGISKDKVRMKVNNINNGDK